MSNPQQYPPQGGQGYGQQGYNRPDYGPPQGYAPEYAQPGMAEPPRPAKAGTSALTWVLLVLVIINLLLTGYLVYVVYRAQSAFAEIATQIPNFPGGLGS